METLTTVKPPKLPKVAKFLKYFKVLYIDSEIEEKSSCSMLENATSLKTSTCAFTVVGDILRGLECFEASHFDIIFVRKEMNYFNAIDFIHVVRHLGSSVPVVILHDIHSPCEEEIQNELHTHALSCPFTPFELCSMIQTVLQPKEPVEGPFFSSDAQNKKKRSRSMTSNESNLSNPGDTLSQLPSCDSLADISLVPSKKRGPGRPRKTAVHQKQQEDLFNFEILEQTEFGTPEAGY
jgi:DNA-binding NtrC family response regulator